MANILELSNAALIVVDTKNKRLFVVDADCLCISGFEPYDPSKLYDLPLISLDAYEWYNAARCWCEGRGD